MHGINYSDCVCRRPSWTPKTQPNDSSSVVCFGAQLYSLEISVFANAEKRVHFIPTFFATCFFDSPLLYTWICTTGWVSAGTLWFKWTPWMWMTITLFCRFSTILYIFIFKIPIDCLWRPWFFFPSHIRFFLACEEKKARKKKVRERAKRGKSEHFGRLSNCASEIPCEQMSQVRVKPREYF